MSFNFVITYLLLQQMSRQQSI